MNNPIYFTNEQLEIIRDLLTTIVHDNALPWQDHNNLVDVYCKIHNEEATRHGFRILSPKPLKRKKSD